MPDPFSKDELALNGFRAIRNLIARPLKKLAHEAGCEHDLDEIGVHDFETWLDREGTVFASSWEILRELLGDQCDALKPLDAVLGRLHGEVTGILIGRPLGVDGIENPVLKEIRRIEEITASKQSETSFTMVSSFRPTEYVEEEFRGRDAYEKSIELKQRFLDCSERFSESAVQIMELE